MSDDTTGALSVEAATNLLSTPEPERKTPGETADPPETASPPEADASEAPEPGDGGETETPEAVEAAAEPPQWWDAEDKAHFLELTPAQQAAVIRNEAKREEVLAKEKGKAADARKAAEAEVANVNNIVAQLNQWLPAAVDKFKSRWGDNPDWVAVTQEYGAEQATTWKFEHDQELKTLQDAHQSRQQAEQHKQALFLRERTEQLVTACPDLSPDKAGEKAIENQTALSQHLVKMGATPQRIRQMDALEMSIAWDAYRFRQGQQSLATKPKPAPAPQRNVAPTGAPSSRSESARAQDLMSKLNRSGRVDDAVAVLNARTARN